MITNIRNTYCKEKKLEKKQKLTDINCEKIKCQIVESSGQSTQVRQRSMMCDTQLLYVVSGPTSVNEDGSCWANDTCALQGYVQMCMRSTLCSGDRDTNKELRTGRQTWDPTLFQQCSCHCRMTSSHAITPYLGNKVICDWHTSNVHNTFGVETRDV